MMKLIYAVLIYFRIKKKEHQSLWLTLLTYTHTKKEQKI